MKLRQRGAGLLVVVILIVTVAAFAVIVAASQSAGDVRGNDMQADSVEALFLAEAGAERALKRYATGAAACGALAENLTDLTQFGIANPSGRTIAILAGLTTDFSGAPLVSSQTQCRVRVTATINVSNVSRTIHAIVDRNLLSGTNNHNFNNPTTAVAPTGWAFAPPAAMYAQNGGPDGPLPCNRSARIWKPAGGGGAAARTVASGTTAIPTVPAVTVTAGSITTVHFHWRAVDRTAIGTCPAYPGGAPAFPCGGAGAAGADGQVCFRLTSTAGGPWTSGRRDINPVTPGTAACATAFNPCSAQYEVPTPPAPVYPTKDSLTIAHGAAVTLNGFIYFMRLQNAGLREMFLDNIELVNPAALNAARVQVWRDCSSAADPVNCV